MRVSEEFLATIDAWIAEQPGELISRSEAVRRLVEAGLASPTPEAAAANVYRARCRRQIELWLRDTEENLTTDQRAILRKMLDDLEAMNQWEATVTVDKLIVDQIREAINR